MTHSFGDGSCACPPPTLSRLGAVLLLLITMFFTARPKNTPHCIRQLFPGFTCQSHSESLLKPPAGGVEDGSLFLSITTSVLLTSFYFVTWHCQSWSHASILKMSQMTDCWKNLNQSLDVDLAILLVAFRKVIVRGEKKSTVVVTVKG